MRQAQGRDCQKLVNYATSAGTVNVKNSGNYAASAGRDCQKLADLSGEYWSGESGNSWNERTLQVLVEKWHDCEMQAVM